MGGRWEIEMAKRIGERGKGREKDLRYLNGPNARRSSMMVGDL